MTRGCGLESAIRPHGDSDQPGGHEELLDDDRQGGRRALVYQRLVVATGVEPIRPDICGLDLPGVYVVHTMDGSIRVDQGARRRGVREVAWSPREAQETWTLCDEELPVETAKNSPSRHTDRTKIDRRREPIFPEAISMTPGPF